METITKVQQKWQGVRQIERRPIKSKKRPSNVSKHEIPYVHRKKITEQSLKWTIFGYANGELKKYKLIYQ